jgi:hypothetical protein
MAAYDTGFDIMRGASSGNSSSSSGGGGTRPFNSDENKQMDQKVQEMQKSRWSPPGGWGNNDTPATKLETMRVQAAMALGGQYLPGYGRAIMGGNVSSSSSSSGGGGGGGGGAAAGGEAGGGAYGGGYGGALSASLQEALDRYYAMQDFAKEEYLKSTTPSKYEPIYKGEFDELDQILGGVYDKLSRAATLVPDEEMLGFINQVAAPRRQYIRDAMDEALQLEDAAYVRSGGDLADPDYRKRRTKATKPYVDAENEFMYNLQTTMPKAVASNLEAIYRQLAAEKASYLGGATSLDEAVRQRQAGGAGTFLNAGTTGALSTVGSGLESDRLGLMSQELGLKAQGMENQMKQFYDTLNYQQQRDTQLDALAQQFGDQYKKDNSLGNKLFSGIVGGIGQVIPGFGQGLLSNLFKKNTIGASASMGY